MMANTAVTTHPARNGQGSAPPHTLEGDMEWNRFPPEFKLGAEEQAKVDAYLAEERSREAASTAAERDALKLALETSRLRVAELESGLVDYGQHGRDCILSRFEAGRPTASHGYEQRYAGTWYEIKPVDKTPPCTCGLDAAIGRGK